MHLNTYLTSNVCIFNIFANFDPQFSRNMTYQTLKIGRKKIIFLTYLGICPALYVYNIVLENKSYNFKLQSYKRVREGFKHSKFEK